MKIISRLTAIVAGCIGGISCLALPGAAQQSAEPGAIMMAPLAAPSPGASHAPEGTAANFGDWVLRCDRNAGATPPARRCRLGQLVRGQGALNVMAQYSVGRAEADEPLRFTTMVPVNATLRSPVKMTTEGTEAMSLDLAWTRCLSVGCLASVVVSAETLRQLKATTALGWVEYHDADDRTVKLAISFRGFGEALVALGNEPTN